MKSKAAVLILLMFICSLKGFGQSAGTTAVPEAVAVAARDNVNKGVQAFRQSQIDAAIAYFKKATELDPNFTSAEIYLATAYAEQFLPHLDSPENQKTAALAVQSFQKVLQKEPSNKIALAGVASLYQNSDQWDKARDAYMRYAAADALNHIPYYGVGTVDWMIVHNPVSKLSSNEKSTLIEEGLRYLDNAMTINPYYEDTLWYENLLIREKKLLLEEKIQVTTDKSDRDRMMAESAELETKANEWVNRALEIRKRNQAVQGLSPNPRITAPR